MGFRGVALEGVALDAPVIFVGNANLETYNLFFLKKSWEKGTMYNA